jgi:hypothetical protein
MVAHHATVLNKWLDLFPGSRVKRIRLQNSNGINQREVTYVVSTKVYDFMESGTRTSTEKGT